MPWLELARFQVSRPEVVKLQVLWMELARFQVLRPELVAFQVLCLEPSSPRSARTLERLGLQAL